MNVEATPLKDLTFLCFDCETTGLSPEHDRIVEIAAVAFRLDGHVLGQFQTLIRNADPIPEEVTRIHGITSEMTAGAPTEASALVGFTYLCGTTQPTVMVAHNAPFDIGFVGRGLRRVGWPLPAAPILDSQLIARQLYPFYKLQTLAQRLGINPGDAHRALSDARTTMIFLLMMLEKHCTPDDTLIDVPGARLFTFGGIMSGAEKMGSKPAGEQAALL